MKQISHNFTGFDDIDFTRKFDMKVQNLPTTSSLTLTMWIDHCPDSYKFIDGMCYPKRKLTFITNEEYTVSSNITVELKTLDEFEIQFRVHLPFLQTAVIDHQRSFVELGGSDLGSLTLSLTSKGDGEQSLFYSSTTSK